ncbi:hypothetical protein GCM10009112_16300 [Marinomonas arenicola]|jgi:hypothetical protein|uniref:DUF1439 domain-containing protein n=1 Tax=Marinomonas arenicola TaxID=569601 RepID=A0ABU9G0R8_9GAMM|nr:DUF1439 domain-containing protein [Marinomonas sp. KMM3893]
MAIRRMIACVVLLVTTLMLTGCDGLSISEAELNQAVAKQLEQSKQNHIQLTLEGGNTLDMNLLVKTAHIDLTDRDGGLALVDLNTDLQGTLSAFGQSFSFSTQVNPSFESGVRLEENRVYLVAPKITKIDVEGSSFSDKMLRSTLGSLHDDFEKALANYFDSHPVYVLDHSTTEKATASMIKDISIKEDAIEFAIF